MLARGVYPLGCAAGMAARAVNDRPYTAMCFVYGFSGRFVGDAYMRPVRFTRYIAFVGTAAAGGIYAAPTNQPILFIIVYGRGRGLPRPY